MQRWTRYCKSDSYPMHSYKLSPAILSARRKAVWTLMRLVASCTLVILGLSSNAIAEGRHDRAARKARPSAPNSNAQQYRLDKELSFRAVHHHALRKTHAIVTLKPGAQLPPALERHDRMRLPEGVMVNGAEGQLLVQARLLGVRIRR